MAEDAAFPRQPCLMWCKGEGYKRKKFGESKEDVKGSGGQGVRGSGQNKRAETGVNACDCKRSSERRKTHTSTNTSTGENKVPVASRDAIMECGGLHVGNESGICTRQGDDAGASVW